MPAALIVVGFVGAVGMLAVAVIALICGAYEDDNP